MATVPEATALDLTEQLARIDRVLIGSAKMQEETREFVAEAHKLSAGERKLAREAELSPWLLLAQGLVAGVALLAARATLAKLVRS